MSGLSTINGASHPPAVDALTRWTDRDQEQLFPTFAPLSTFLSPKVYRVTDVDGSKVTLVGEENGTQSVDATAVVPYDALRADPRPRITLVDGTVLVPRIPYDKISAASSDFGGTFNLNERLKNDEWLYKGCNIFEMDPRNLMDSNSAKGFIFHAPVPNTKDYHVTDICKAVPNGILVHLDPIGETSKITHGVTSESSYQASYATTIGAKVGYGPVSFSDNLGFTTSCSNSVNASAGMEIEIERAYLYRAVLDMQRVEIEDFFLERVQELCDALDGSQLPALLASLVDAYGTHYANAAIYGYIRFNEMHYSNDDMLNRMSSGMSLSEEAGVEGLASVNVEVKVDTESSTGSGTSDSNSKGSWVGSADFPTPVRCDLRPLSDVLNPVLFPSLDEGALSNCQRKLRAYLDDLAAKRSPFSDESVMLGKLSPTTKILVRVNMYWETDIFNLDGAPTFLIDGISKKSYVGTNFKYPNLKFVTDDPAALQPGAQAFAGSIDIHCPYGTDTLCLVLGDEPNAVEWGVRFAAINNRPALRVYMGKTGALEYGAPVYLTDACVSPQTEGFSMILDVPGGYHDTTKILAQVFTYE